MQHECKITVLETKVFPEYQKKYLADLNSGACPCFKAGDTFLLKRTPEQDDFYHLMNGKFCGEAWDAISRYVYAALQGGSIIYQYIFDRKETHLQLRTFDERTKKTVYEQQHKKCFICGEIKPYCDMHGDHWIPWSRGGTTTIDNCKMLCTLCNLKKSANNI